MLVGHTVSNYEGRSAFVESTDTSQLVESMTDYLKHNNLSIPNHC